jgi:hypothetical protein
MLQGIPRELVSLLAEFVSGSMICFAVCDRCDGVGVGCQIVKFCGSIVRTLRHSVPLTCMMQTVRPGATKKLIDAGRLPPKVRILGPGKLPNLADQGYWEVARC